MAMSDLEFQRWRQRLQHAENLWRENGWIPDGKEGSAGKFSAMAFLDGYRGKFPKSMNGAMEEADQMVGNIFFSIVNTTLAQVSSKIPDPILRPLGGPAADADARRRAWLNEQLVEFMVRERDVKNEADRAFQAAMLTGAGFVRHGFTPEVSFENDDGKIIARFKNQTPDLPWVQFMRPWEMRIDPLVNSFNPKQEPRWCAFYNMHYEDSIKDDPNLIFRRDLTATKHFDTRPEGSRGTKIESGSPDVMSVYEEWVIYDAQEQRFFGISPGSEKLIREERPWSFAFGQLPYSYLAFNDQTDTPFPIAFPQMFWDEQLLYNKVWTVINALVGRMRRLIFANKDAISPEVMDLLRSPNGFMEIIEAEGGDLANAIKEIGVAPIDGQLIGLTYQLKESIREVVGVSNFDRGQRANVETAAEANNIAAGGTIARGRLQERYEEFWKNIITVMHRTFLQSEQARQMVIPIIGKRNLDFLTADDRAQGFVTVDIADLQGEFSYDVKLDSTLRTDPNTELARTVTGYNVLGGVQSQIANQDYYANRIAELSGADPEQAIVSEQVRNQMAAQSQGGEGEGQGDSIPSAAQNAMAQGLRPVPAGA
jgi:hypothetical protein